MFSDHFSTVPKHFVCAVRCVIRSVMFSHRSCIVTAKLVAYHLYMETAMKLMVLTLISSVLSH